MAEELTPSAKGAYLYAWDWPGRVAVVPRIFLLSQFSKNYFPLSHKR